MISLATYRRLAAATWRACQRLCLGSDPALEAICHAEIGNGV